MLKTGGLCSKQEKVFRGCILSALTSHLSNKHTPWRALWRRCKRFDPSCRLVESTFTWKSQTNISFGFRIRELLYTNWPQKNVFQPITKVEANNHWMYANTYINPQSQKVCIFAKCLVLFWFSECQVEVQEWQMNHPLFVDFSNPPLGSKRCPRMSIFFVYNDQNIYKNYGIILSYHL